MNTPIDEDDLRRLSELEPTVETMTGRVASRIRRRQRRSRVVLSACLVAVATIGGLGLWRLGERDEGSTADVPITESTVSVPTTVTDVPQFVFPATSCQAPQPDLVVFMNVDATRDEVDVVGRHLEASAEVASRRFLDHQAAYEEFTVLFSDSPEMLASVGPQDLSASFRVVLVDDASRSAAAEPLRDLSGVKDVLVNPCTTRVDRDPAN